MKNPLVTIVTPSLNQGRFIRATIESVLTQDYPKIEYIVMDGGSTDETASIAREYANRLTFISEKDRGQAHAINKGVRMARGEIVSWLNSDDVLLPEAISRVVREFSTAPSLCAVYGEGYLIDENGEIKSRFPATEPFNLWKLIHVWDYILQQTVFLRRSILDEIGFVNEDLHWAMDWDLLIRIGERYHIRYLTYYLACLREYQEAKTFTGGHRRFQELVSVLRTYSGRRYPPGYLVYGLDTYSIIAARFLPSERLRRRLAQFTHLWIGYLLNESQGLGLDGWAGQHLHYMLPAGADGQRKIRFLGFVPEIPALIGQHLTVTCNNSVTAQREVSFGEFAIEFETNDPQRPPYIEIKATKATPGTTIGPCLTGPRMIAFRMLEINWANTS